MPTITKGYRRDFLGDGFDVPMPKLSKTAKADLLANEIFTDGMIHHLWYSVVISVSRRLALFSSANLDAGKIHEIRRTELTSSWKVESGLEGAAIIGHELYKKSSKKLERGHLTPVDCMEWGDDEATARQNANDTFFFSNAVPQIKRLNGTEWGMLESYIGRQCAKAGNGRLCVHTGCVFLEDDPEYIFSIDGGVKIKIPRFFWKVIYFLDSKMKMKRIAFMMGQERLLNESGLVIPPPVSRKVAAPDDEKEAFEDLEKNKTYQVNIKFLQSQIDLHFPKAEDVFTEKRLSPLTLKSIEISPDGLESANEKGVLISPRTVGAPATLKIMEGLVM